MKFTNVSIDGYGRFSDKDVDLSPGFQIIAGPNERGKSTLRRFISDMLYGQKRSSTRRIYDDSQELLSPWHSNNGYGGRLRYHLDNGTQYEVERNFNPDKEFVRVFDRTNAQDVTSDYPTLRNRESTFAEKHLNMTKSVYLGTATISHVSLNELGDRQALIQIREKLLSLADSGSEDRSAEMALQWLQDRATTIGQPTARTKPLPITRQQLTDLQAEYEEVHEAAAEVSGLEKQRAAVMESIGKLGGQKTKLEEELARHEHAERTELVRRAQHLHDRLNAAKQELSQIGGADSFELEQVPDVQRLAALVDTASQQVDRTRDELIALAEQLKEEVARLENMGVAIMKEADPELEGRIIDLDEEIARMNERLSTLEEARGRTESGQAETAKLLEAVADFSRVDADPVQFFSRLQGGFDVARHGFVDESDRLERLREAAAAKTEELAEPKQLFSGEEDFLTAIRRFEAGVRERDEVAGKYQRETTSLTHEVEDLGSKLPGFTVFAVGALCVAVAFGVVAWFTGNDGIFAPAGIVGLMCAYFAVSAALTRRRLHHTRDQLDEIHADEEAEVVQEVEGRERIEALMEKTSSETPRELEAVYERYRKSASDLETVEAQVAEQEARADEAETRLDEARDAVREAFDQVGEKYEADERVQEGTARVLTRYQEYRDAKRRNAEFRDSLERNESETEALKEQIYERRKEELEVSLKVREFLRGNHYPEEKNFDSAVQALRSYRIKSAQARQKQSELEVHQGQIKMAKRQLEAEENQLAGHQATLDEHLKRAGVQTIEAYLEKARHAQTGRELAKEEQGLAEQLQSLIGDQDFETFRATLPEATDDSAPSDSSAEDIKEELERIGTELETRRNQEHALHIMITERGAGLRTLNEVDEERGATEQRMAELELEMQAAHYAKSVIEEVTREQHSRIAPRLAEIAGNYLKEITDGVYDELLIDRDMQISVRIPQTKSMDADPERRLSKGTVDQIYFALRLAMIDTLSEDSEGVPMVLDDPFANYDDNRLACAMKLLARVGDENQILLFTCREDIVRAAEAVGAPVLHI